MNLCTTIGQEGSVESTAEPRILSTTEIRLAVFRAISKYKIGEKHWPLWLPPPLRALVSIDIANQVMRPATSSSETAPEMFIANGCVLAIIETLKGWEAFPKSERLASGDRDTVDYELPLSLQDARLFLVAVGRLSPAEKMKLLAKLLSGVRSSLKAIAGNIVRKNREFSSLIARIITVCSNLTVLVAFPDLEEKLRNQVKHGHLLELPGFVSECDWYRSERCYMGVFSDWESPRAPLSESGETVTLSSSVANDLSAVLEQSLALGFASARSDRGHLLFASWNAMGNNSLWEPQRSSDRPRGNPWDSLLADMQISMEEGKEVGIAKVLTQIREDVCRLYVDMQVHAGQAGTLPLASKLTQSKDRSASTAAQIKKGLKALLGNGERIITTLLECEDTSPELFSSLEAAAVYVTFGVASHTKPSNEDAFSISRAGLDHERRPRGYSSDSEREHSDLDSVDSDSDDDDPSSRLRERLQAACADFGAAPTHPDWLDDNCRLQFGVGSSEALDVARTAVRTLTKLLSTCHARHNRCLQKALNVLRNDRRSKDIANENILARKLLILVSRYGMEPHQLGSLLNAGEEGEDYRSSELLASLCNLDVDSLELYMSGRESENLEETKTAWCPNSAQRILGRFQESSKATDSPWLSGPSDSACSLPELRVDKQWEVLLGTSLATACRDVLQESENSESVDYSEEAQKAFLDAEYW